MNNVTYFNTVHNGWCIQNHGTKWNAIDAAYYDYTKEIRFQTAWSAPVPVIEKLAEMFPDVTITFLWADEDIGSNCGEMFFYANEGQAESFVENFSSEAYAIYIECWGESDCIEKDEDGNYVRKDCEECKICA